MPWADDLRGVNGLKSHGTVDQARTSNEQSISSALIGAHFRNAVGVNMDLSQPPLLPADRHHLRANIRGDNIRADDERFTKCWV